MGRIELAFLLSGLLLAGCGQAERTHNRNETSIKTEHNPTMPEKFVDSAIAQDDDATIESTIKLFQEKDIDKISGIIRFPLSRQYPIPPINDKEAFKKRFNEVFDEILINKIANATVDQWSEVGWRGTMLDDGVVWMAESDGVITAVNYQSEFERKLRNKLIAQEKGSLHSSLNDFESPTFKINTKSYQIRIDELANGKYRYASWKIGAAATAAPDIILSNGELQFEGSGGNHHITFKKEHYLYKVYRNHIGEENLPDITLTVEKDGRTILTEDGTLIVQ